MGLFVEIVGWLGSIAVLSAYLMVSFNWGKENKKLYQVLNLFGSICLIINTAYHHAYPSAFVNLIWLIIAIVALFNIRKMKKVRPY